MDRDRLTLIAHGDLPLHNPLSPAALDEALDHVPLAPGDRVADIGCGTGELLLGLAARPGVAGIGIDSSQPAIERARAAARSRGVDVEFVVGDARAFDPGDGEFALAACVGSTHALGGLDATADRLARLVRPGGHVLVADGYWQREPEPAYLDALCGASADELPDWAGLMRALASPGLRPVWMSVASDADWDRYEWTLIANGERWLAEHPGDPDAADVLAWIDRPRRWLLAGRGTMGFVVVVLVKPPG